MTFASIFTGGGGADMGAIATGLSAADFLPRCAPSEGAGGAASRLPYRSATPAPWRCHSGLYPRWDALRAACERHEPGPGCQCAPLSNAENRAKEGM